MDMFEEQFFISDNLGEFDTDIDTRCRKTEKKRLEIFDKVKPSTQIFKEIHHLISNDRDTQKKIKTHIDINDPTEIDILWTGTPLVGGLATKFITNHYPLANSSLKDPSSGSSTGTFGPAKSKYPSLVPGPVALKYERYTEYGITYHFSYIEISNQFHKQLENYCKVISKGPLRGWLLKVTSRPRNYIPFGLLGYKIKIILKRND